MIDTIIKGSGNSRFLRTVPNAMTLYQNDREMLQAMVDGSFPIDLLGPNPLGCEQVGTPLNAANLATLEQGSYVGTGYCFTTTPVTLTCSEPPKLILIFGENSRLFARSQIGILCPYLKAGQMLWRTSSDWSGNAGDLRVDLEGNTAKWWTTNGNAQNGGAGYLGLNQKDMTYYYSAFV